MFKQRSFSHLRLITIGTTDPAKDLGKATCNTAELTLIPKGFSEILNSLL